MHLLQLVSCLALVVGASTQTHMESSKSGRLSCTDNSTIESIVRGYEMEQEYDVDSVLLNCCVEEADGSLRKAIVSAFFTGVSLNSTGVRFEFSYLSGTVVVRELRHVLPLNFSWEGMHCFECNTSATTGDELCSECHEFCVSCNGSTNSELHCQRCKYATNESAMDNYCLNGCEHGFQRIEGCPVTGCLGVLRVIGAAEIEVAGTSHAEGTSEEGQGAESLPFEFECLPPNGCPSGQTQSKDMPPICYGGGILYCNVSAGADCAQCYAPFIRMEPLHFQEDIREEAEHKVEEEGGHFKENCLEHVTCLTEQQIEECAEEFVRVQSEILKEEIAEERMARISKDLALKTALPIVCGLAIIVFVSLSIFAHYRYPHVAASGEKRHRKKKEEEEVTVNQTWRPRPTIRYR